MSIGIIPPQAKIVSKIVNKSQAARKETLNRFPSYLSNHSATLDMDSQLPGRQGNAFCLKTPSLGLSLWLPEPTNIGALYLLLNVHIHSKLIQKMKFIK